MTKDADGKGIVRFDFKSNGPIRKETDIKLYIDENNLAEGEDEEVIKEFIEAINEAYKEGKIPYFFDDCFELKKD